MKWFKNRQNNINFGTINEKSENVIDNYYQVDYSYELKIDSHINHMQSNIFLDINVNPSIRLL